MKKFKVYLLGSGIFFGLMIGVIIYNSPDIIVVHFGGNGERNYYGSKYTLLIYLVLVVLINWIILYVDKKHRKRNGIEELPLLTVGECQLICASMVIELSIIILSLYQVDILGS